MLVYLKKAVIVKYVYKHTCTHTVRCKTDHKITLYVK